VAAANEVLAAHPAALPVRSNGDWLEIARQDDTLPFADLVKTLAPFTVHEIKPVEQSFEDLLHGFYVGKNLRADAAEDATV
jgi:ABC-2 type transport system ATP-binding protein